MVRTAIFHVSDCNLACAIARVEGLGCVVNDAKSAGNAHELVGQICSRYAVDLVARAVLRGEMTVELSD
jgi:hypothetical protein